MVTVLYHNDVDGFASAWVASKCLRTDIKYVAVDHGWPVPWDLVDGEQVYIFDFAYDEETMRQIFSRAGSLVCLDHHQDSMYLNSIEGCRCDVSRSGCMLAWDFLGRPESCGELVAYINDGDLKKFELPDSRDIYAVVKSVARSFEIWDDLAEILSYGTRFLADCGQMFSRGKRRMVDFILRNAVLISLDGHVVWAVNTSVHQGECGSALAHKSLSNHSSSNSVLSGVNPLFGVTWWMLADRRVCVSMRSRDGFDVGEIASKHGGGGHPGAAAFTFSPGEHPELMKALLGTS